MLGQVLVVGVTHEEDVLRPVVPANAKGMSVVVLEPVALRATSTPLVYIAASVPVALVHRTPDRSGDVARGRGGIGLRQTLPGSARPGVALGFQPFELLSHRLFDDRGQVSVGHSCAHEGPQALQLVMELGAGRELNQIPSGSQGLDDGAPSRARSRRSADSV
jgi:hypothetical protein